MNKLLSLLAIGAFITVSASLHAEYIEATQLQQYNVAIQSPKALVMVASKSCPHCVSTKPKFASAAGKNSSVKFVLIDTETPALKSVVSNLNVHSVPAFRLFKNGRLVESSEGQMSEGSISALARK